MHMNQFGRHSAGGDIDVVHCFSGTSFQNLNVGHL